VHPCLWQDGLSGQAGGFSSGVGGRHGAHKLDILLARRSLRVDRAERRLVLEKRVTD
jgi:hypothetical protein